MLIWPFMPAITGGRVVVPGFVFRICATTNSFQQSMNVKAPPATRPGPDTGSTTRQYAWRRLQPSTSALLSRSAGKGAEEALLIPTGEGGGEGAEGDTTPGGGVLRAGGPENQGKGGGSTTGRRQPPERERGN